MALEVGKQAPDFELPATGNAQVSLADYLARGPVVLVFYCKDDTSG
ncbi:MAG: redoxin domain-containing protein [Chloroflexi bacterium]|nr:redoxin domain-containing protein [Chloroflexota bacterium]